MPNFDDDSLISQLRDIMKLQKVSIKTISDDLEIPYRTLQNQFSGSSKIPASTFLRIVNYLNIPASVITHNCFVLNDKILAQVLVDYLGSALPTITAGPDNAFVIDTQDESMLRTPERMIKDANFISTLLALGYGSFPIDKAMSPPKKG